MRTSAGFFMPETSRCYQKPPLLHSDLLSRFAERGLIIPDTERAIRYLCHISYFRLSGYGLAYEEFGENQERLHRFREGSSFDDLLRAYVIDRRMRVMAIDAIERIEVAIRSTINHEMSCRYVDSHWYLQDNLFFSTDQFNHQDLLREIRRHTARNADPGSDKEQRREQFIRHYYTQYSEPDLPPCWMIAEVLPLGTWSKVYQHLNVSKDRKRISRQFDLPPHTLDSWLHTLTYLRNLCAHHSRLYYRPLVIIPRQDKGLPFDPVNRFSNYAAVIHWFLKQVSPKSTWEERLKELLNELPENEHIHYGFRPEWFQEPFWT